MRGLGPKTGTVPAGLLPRPSRRGAEARAQPALCGRLGRGWRQGAARWPGPRAHSFPAPGGAHSCWALGSAMHPRTDPFCKRSSCFQANAFICTPGTERLEPQLPRAADRFAAAASAGPLKTNALEQKTSAPRPRPLPARPWARLPEAEAERSPQALAAGRCTPASVSPSTQGGVDKRSARCRLLAGIRSSRHRGRQRRAGQTRGPLLGSLPFR